jgi:hypothetical protein
LGAANRERSVLVVGTRAHEARVAREPVGRNRRRGGCIASGNLASILTEGTDFAGVRGS